MFILERNQYIIYIYTSIPIYALIEPEQKGEALDLPVNLRSYPHL